MIAEVTVTIPACNEQADLGACLSSVTDACRELRSRRSVETRIVVALDACTDGTAAVAAGYPWVEVVTVDARCVGTARGSAAAVALGTAVGAHDHWLASTDADCRVPQDWLVAMVEHADAGYDLVLGTVSPLAGLTADQHGAWLARHDLTDGHPHVHGANLGIRADTYVAVGGWPPVRLHEDVGLVERVTADARWRVRRSGGPSVLTSARMDGRVELGFAGFLRGLAEDLVTARVPEPGHG